MTYQIFAVSGCQKMGIRNLSKDAISLNVSISDFCSQTPNLKMLKKCAWNEFGVFFSGPIQDSDQNVMDPKHWLDRKVHVVNVWVVYICVCILKIISSISYTIYRATHKGWDFKDDLKA